MLIKEASCTDKYLLHGHTCDSSCIWRGGTFCVSGLGIYTKNITQKMLFCTM